MTYIIKTETDQHVFPVWATEVMELLEACNLGAGGIWRFLAPDDVPCEMVVDTTELIIEGRKFLDSLRGNEDRLDHQFELRERDLFDKKKRRKVASPSAIIRSGMPWILKAGRGICLLEKYDQEPGGTREVIDLRGQSEIDDDNGRIIEIVKKCVPQSPVAKELPSLIDFLETLDIEEVTLAYFERRPSVPELVEMFSLGGGSKDYAGEILFNMGEKAEKQLVKMLKSSKYSDLHGQVEFLLSTVFGDDNEIYS